MSARFTRRSFLRSLGALPFLPAALARAGGGRRARRLAASQAPVVAAQLNLWFRSEPHLNNYQRDGRWMVSLNPRLGYTDSADREVLAQEMQWIHRYSLRTGRKTIYSIEWIQPGDLSDRNISRAFLPVVEQTRARWNIFYDPVLAARQRGLAFDTPIDFSRPAVSDMFLSDLAYLSQYFEHPRYWRLRGKPVLYVWSVNSGIERAHQPFETARSMGVYLLGDVFGGNGPEPPLDARTGFVAATPAMTGRTDLDVHGLLLVFNGYYQDALARGDTIPALSCQFDDTEFQNLVGGAPTRILARQKEDVTDLLRLAKSYSTPIGSERYVWLGTYNNWAEGTTLLPTRRQGERFYDMRGGIRRIGHYEFDHLEAVREVLFPGAPRYRGPRIVRRPRKVLFKDCDVAGRLKVRGPGVDGLLNAPAWADKSHLERARATFDYRWVPEWQEGADPTAPVVLEFTNLDGLTASTVLGG